MTQPSDDWYRPEIPRKELKELMTRVDSKGLIDFGIWAMCLVSSGYLAHAVVGSFWAIPAFLLNGIIYSSCDARRTSVPRNSLQDALAERDFLFAFVPDEHERRH